MKPINWPTAAVVIVIIVAWCLFGFTGRPIPTGLAAVFGSVGAVITAALPKLFPALFAGGKDDSAS